MNRSSLFISLVLTASGFSMSAQSIMTVTDSNRRVEVTALTDNIIRVENAPSGTVVPQSRTTVITTSDSDAERATTSTAMLLTTPTGVNVALDKAVGSVTITAGHDRLVRDSGVRVDSDGMQTISLTTSGNESFYGAGERGYSFNLAGDTLVMYNRQNYGYVAGENRIKQMNITMPLVISSRGYAILFDDYAAARMVMSNPIVYTSEAPAPVAYFFINGVDGSSSEARLASVVKQLSSLTGRQQLPPFWALGYITSKYGYHNEAETRGAIDSLRRGGYPVDGIVLDLYWYGKEQDMGRLEWETSQWPNHRKMLSDLKKQGVNLVAISQPYVLRNGRALGNYEDLSARGMFVKDSVGGPGEVKIWVGEGGMFDVSNPETRQWLADRYQALTDDGVTGWWGDLGEPEVHPEGLVHANGLTTRQYHNLYGNDWSQIIFDLFQKKYPDTRLMTMMRGGTTGLQRFNVFPWSTDVSRSWGGLEPQITIMLNSGLSGLGYMSHDVGGFAIDKDNPIDPELYIRWLQLGLFSPILRTHSQFNAEPYHYPAYQNIILPLIRKRYRWLPYNYTLAFENASEGHPLVRPLNYYDAGSVNYDDISDQYLWGRDVMVAPVTRRGATSRRVVFPAGTWVDVNEPGKIYHGGDTIRYSTPLHVIPLFARAGAFIPMADYKMNNTTDYRTDDYTVRFYPVEGKSDGYIFEDDMTTPTTIDKGSYALLRFVGTAAPDSVTIDLMARAGSDTYEISRKNKSIKMEVFNMATCPAAVTFDGEKIKFQYDQKLQLLTFEVKWDTSADAQIVIAR